MRNIETVDGYDDDPGHTLGFGLALSSRQTARRPEGRGVGNQPLAALPGVWPRGQGSCGVVHQKGSTKPQTVSDA